MRRRFEQHLRGCAGCNAYLDEVRVTVATVGRVGDEELDPAFRAQLLHAFAATAGPR